MRAPAPRPVDTDGSQAKLAVPELRCPAGTVATVRPPTWRRRNSAFPARAISNSIRRAPALGFGAADRIRLASEPGERGSTPVGLVEIETLYPPVPPFSFTTTTPYLPE